MRWCPKCDKKFDDRTKLCRACGGILHLVPDEPPSRPQPTDAVTVQPGEWACCKCRENVPNSFDACWNCGAERFSGNSGVGGITDPAPANGNVASSARTVTCRACGSPKIIPNAVIADQGEYSNGSLSVVVHGNPAALVFKDRLYSKMTADICGDCGNAHIFVGNPHELYEHYQKSLQQS